MFIMVTDIVSGRYMLQDPKKKLFWEISITGLSIMGAKDIQTEHELNKSGWQFAW